MTRPSRDRWVLFYDAPTLLEANIVMGVLKSAGIPAVVQPLGIPVYGIGGAHILVPREKLQEAQKVLEEAQNAGEPIEGDNGTA